MQHDHLPSPCTSGILPITILALLLVLPIPVAGSDDTGALFRQGLALQKQHHTLKAIAIYKKILRLNPDHARTHYELGWSYWVLERWDQVVKHWEIAKSLNLAEPDLAIYLKTAWQNLKGQNGQLTRTAIGTQAVSREAITGADQPASRLRLTLIARFQHYNPKPQDPADRYDPYVFSPKSVRFFPDGSKVYVNALEGLMTLVFDPAKLKLRKRIVHNFRKRHRYLFQSQAGRPWSSFPAEVQASRDTNVFAGKPVESAFTNHARYLWVPYYRRDFDRYGVMPSAVAIIDTSSDRIVRVMDTGPIPKYVSASPDGKWLAVIHWGNNTVGLIDVSSGHYTSFRRDALITVGPRLGLNSVADTDRDHNCGYCLRGAVFTRDSRYLLVARMGGGGIAVIDTVAKRYIGTAFGMRPTPRHIVLSPDGSLTYIALSFSGYVAVYRTRDLIQAALERRRLQPLREVRTGSATRTIALSPDGSLLFAAVNLESKIVALTAPGLKPLLTIPADSYPVGLDVSPDGRQLWVTAQGRKLQGGNSVMVFRISRIPAPTPGRKSPSNRP